MDAESNLTVFGILSEFKGKEENLKMLAQVLDAICTERFWALPAHVNFDALDEKTIDLLQQRLHRVAGDCGYTGR